MMNKFIFAAIVLTAQLCPAAETFRVVDGDSLERGGERIRLLDIDAPEFLQKCYDGNGWKYRCGFEATEFMRSLVRPGITCRQHGVDKYGRSLMECYQENGMNINRQMVLQGHAVAYGKKYQKEEAEARAARRGIWRGRFMRPELYRALKKSRERSRK